MLTVEENKIYLTRGDTAYLDFKLEDANEGDKLYFSVKKNIEDKEYAFQIEIDPLTEAFTILPEMTNDLEYGKYYYDVQWNTTKGEIFTLIQKKPLYLKEEVNTSR